MFLRQKNKLQISMYSMLPFVHTYRQLWKDLEEVDYTWGQEQKGDSHRLVFYMI